MTLATQWQVLRQDFSTSLQAEGKYPNTLPLYLGAVDKLAQWVDCPIKGSRCQSESWSATSAHLLQYGYRLILQTLIVLGRRNWDHPWGEAGEE